MAMPTRPHLVLGEDFRAKKQKRVINKNRTESLTNLEQIFDSVEDKVKNKLPPPHDPFSL
jgi:hypothetical protein